MSYKNLLRAVLVMLTVGTIYSANATTIEVDNGPTVQFNGVFHTQAGARIQAKLDKEEKNLTSHNNKIALYTEAALGLDISHKVDNLTYGVNLHLIPTTQLVTAPDYTGTHIYFISDFGKIEIGSPYDAGAKMGISGGDIAAGSGDWSRYANLEPNYVKTHDLAPEFADSPESFFSSAKTHLNKGNDDAEPPRLISFFTPEVEGLQVGVSFIPDSSNTGGASHNINSNKKNDITLPGEDHKLEINKSVRNGFAGGVSYTHNIDDGIDLKLAATGEYGKSVGGITETIGTEVKKSKLSDLRSYNVGATLSYGNFLYGASYGNSNKSLTSKLYNKTGRNVEFYNGSVAFGMGPSKTSLSYFKSFKYKNTLDAVTLGTEYKASGLQPYAEVTYFKAGGRHSLYNANVPKKKLRGTIALLGLKLKI